MAFQTPGRVRYHCAPSRAAATAKPPSDRKTINGRYRVPGSSSGPEPGVSGTTAGLPAGGTKVGLVVGAGSRLRGTLSAGAGGAVSPAGGGVAVVVGSGGAVVGTVGTVVAGSVFGVVGVVAGAVDGIVVSPVSGPTPWAWEGEPGPRTEMTKRPSDTNADRRVTKRFMALPAVVRRKDVPQPDEPDA